MSHFSRVEEVENRAEEYFDAWHKLGWEIILQACRDTCNLARLGVIARDGSLRRWYTQTRDRTHSKTVQLANFTDEHAHTKLKEWFFSPDGCQQWLEYVGSNLDAKSLWLHCCKKPRVLIPSRK